MSDTPAVLSDDDLSDLRGLASTLQDDLLTQVDDDESLRSELRGAWNDQKESDRTADSFTDWTERYTEQVAVHWVLTAVFVRYLEDNRLVDEHWLAGIGDAAAEAEDNLSWFWSEHPTASETDYLLHIFRRLAEYPAGEVFSEERNALYKMRPSGDAGKAVVNFFRDVDPDTGELEYTFAVDHTERPGDTRFLGDLYQDLSKAARKRYALLQTPEFVEEFILEHSLDEALDTFGLGPRPGEVTDDNHREKFRFIDPACGSGHFLLGGFRRVLDRMMAEWPGEPRSLLVRRALDTVHGVDLNPFAVEIARFRLLIAALYAIEDPGATASRRSDGSTPSPASQSPSLTDAPDLPLKIACGDSLIHGQFHPRFETDKTQNQAQLELDRFRWDDKFATDDADLIYGEAAERPSGAAAKQTSAESAADGGESKDELGGSAASQLGRSGERSEPGILMQQYHAVVGNPPYITVKDKALNSTYREFYDSCYYQYSLVCPFYERFFDLAGGEQLSDDLFDSGWEWEEPGYVGLIMANSFMKRTFGRKLVEEIISRTDLSHVIDTSGAYLPGHGTPTVILFGRNRDPLTSKARAVLGIRAEPQLPDDPATAQVWSSVRDHIDDPGFENDFITVTELSLDLLHDHPWTLQGGGALEAKSLVESKSKCRLNDEVTALGYICMTRADQLYLQKSRVLSRNGLPNQQQIQAVAGAEVRDWKIGTGDAAVFPYSDSLEPIEIGSFPSVHQFLWPHRSRLWLRNEPGGNHKELDLTWYEWSRFQKDRFRKSLAVTYAEIATDNHFAFDRGGKVFKQTAPVLKLRGEAEAKHHLSITGPLNSSSGSFWMKQTFQPKAGSGLGRGIQPEPWMERYQRDGTKLKQFPLPAEQPIKLTRRLDNAAQTLATAHPRSLCQREIPSAKALDETRNTRRETLHQMIPIQEELDWQMYRAYGLCDHPPLAVDYVDTETGEQVSESADEQKPAQTADDELTSSPAHQLTSTDDRREQAYDALPDAKLGERPFEIVLARKMEEGKVDTSWFERHDSEPRTDIPERWPEWYRDLVRDRIECIDEERFVRLIEKPEFKRRWNLDDWEDLEDDALRQWLGDRLETPRYFPLTERMEENPARLGNGEPGMGNGDDAEPTLVKVSTLAHEATQDEAFMTVAERYTGDASFDVEALVRDIVFEDSVPYLPSQRYTDSGVKRREEWERVWDLQRIEDGERTFADCLGPTPEHLEGLEADLDDIPKPPKYRVKDYEERRTYDNRGKLDVPKERFIHYPGLEGESADDMVVAWAGYDHLEQARALATFYYDARNQHGWADTDHGHTQLTHLLAGLLDLLPWLHQWHSERDDDGTVWPEFVSDMIESQAKQLGVSLDDIETIRLTDY